MEIFEIDILALQETECLHQPKEQLLQSRRGKSYLFVHTGAQKGVGFLVSQKIQVVFENFIEISSRIIQLNIFHQFQEKLTLFSIYCPIDQRYSSSKSEKNLRFFGILNKAIEGVKKGTIITILGDFNCTLRKKHHFPPFIGQFGLRENLLGDSLGKTNADCVFEMSCRQKLKVANTLLKKKLCQISTFEPIQTITNANKLERTLHLKDLILTNSSSINYSVNHIQPLKHTAHHLVLYDLSSKKKKGVFAKQDRKLFSQPLRPVSGVQFEAKLRDIDEKYPSTLQANLETQCASFTRQKDVNIDLLYQSIVTTIQHTCQSFHPTPQPKHQWCSEKTMQLAKEKNQRWRDFLKTHSDAQKKLYQQAHKRLQKSVILDKKNFQELTKAKISIHQSPPNTLASSVFLFFPTKNERTILKLKNFYPLLMRASAEDPLLPAAKALQMHLLKIYSQKNMTWLSELFEPVGEQKTKILEVWEKTNSKLVPFLPPMNTKAPGVDGLYLHSLMGAEKYLEILLKEMKKQKKPPLGFKESLVFPLFKKGNRTLFDCYRTIALRPIISNYLFRSYIPTCREITVQTVLPFQFNRPKHNCHDNIFILTRIIDLCKSSNVSLFLLFSDIKKAFDSICRKFLYKVLQKRCPEALASILCALHEKARLLFERLLTTTESGVLQGDTLAAIIFVWVMDEVMREWERRKNKKWGIKIVFRKGETLKDLLPHDWHQNISSAEILDLLLNWLGFADDIIFISTSLEEILEAFKLFCDICLSVGLEINFGKCGLIPMQWNHERTPKKIVIMKQELPIVKQYAYLGVLVTNEGTFSFHVEERSQKALGVVSTRIKNAQSWIGKNASMLLKQLNLCFAPCLAWGTEVITLKKTDLAVLDVAFFKFLRRVFRVKFDEITGKWEKSNKELSQLAEMKPPSEVLPLARLRFLFHSLSITTTYNPACFLNGKIEIGEKELATADKRKLTYTSHLYQDWKKFGITDLEISVASVPSFQKNIFNECSSFDNSLFAKVAGKGQIIEDLSPPLIPNFPPITGTTYLFATDGSLKKTKKEVKGSFSVVDSFGHFYAEKVDCDKKTSSTLLELLALKKLFSALIQEDIKDCTIIFIVDSLPALKLTLGLDVRAEHAELFREMDELRNKLLQKDMVKEIFIHVRSHRNVFVPINSEADLYAGLPNLGEEQPSDIEKCPPECKQKSLCPPCQWNSKVNSFLASIQPTPTHLSIWGR